MKHRGFTIVELLIVIVVIGILAALTIVTFSGIQSRVIDSSMQTDITSSAKLLANDFTIDSLYPSSASVANSGKGLPLSNGSTYVYVPNNTTNPASYTLTIANTKSKNSYYVTNTISTPTLVASGAGPSGSSDSFDRANASSLGTASNGQIWNIVSGTGWKISGNKVLQNESSGTVFRVATLPTGLSDGTASVDMVMSTTMDAGLALRVQDDTNYIFVDVTATGGNYVTKTFRKSSGGFAGLTTLTTLTGITPGMTISLKAVMAGSTVTIYVNSGAGYVQVGQSTTVTGLESQTAQGLASNSNQTDSQFDNFLIVP